MTESNPNAPGRKALLNEFQARRLRVTCHYIDRLLAEVEEVLNLSASRAAFPRYYADIPPGLRPTIEDYIAGIRSQLVRVLDDEGIAKEDPSIPASRAVHVLLGTIDIALEELKPHYMRGYGDVSHAVATELNGIIDELRGWVSKLDRCIADGVGRPS